MNFQVMFSLEVQDHTHSGKFHSFPMPFVKQKEFSLGFSSRKFDLKAYTPPKTNMVHLKIPPKGKGETSTKPTNSWVPACFSAYLPFSHEALSICACSLMSAGCNWTVVPWITWNLEVDYLEDGLPGLGYVVRTTPIYRPKTCHLEGEPEPYLGDYNDHHGPINH